MTNEQADCLMDLLDLMGVLDLESSAFQEASKISGISQTRFEQAFNTMENWLEENYP